MIRLGMITFILCVGICFSAPLRADVPNLSLAADRCTIGYALTGRAMAGCHAPAMAGRTTRSLPRSDTGYFVNFDFASEDLSQEVLEHLARLSKLLAGPLSDLCVKLVGHTDTRGSDGYNQTLSERRAKSVWMFMVGPGMIQSGRIVAEGRGETEPLKNMLGSDPKNRRVEILAKKTAIGTCH